MFPNSNFATEIRLEADDEAPAPALAVGDPRRLSGGAGPPPHRAPPSLVSLSDDDDDGDDEEAAGHDMSTWRGRLRRYLGWLKIAALLVVWGCFTVLLMVTVEEEPRLKLLMVPPQVAKEFAVPVRPLKGLLGVDLHGPFDNKEFEKDGEDLVAAHLTLHVLRKRFGADGALLSSRQVSEAWTLELTGDRADLEEADLVVKHHTFRLQPADEQELQQDASGGGRSELYLQLETSKDTVDRELSLQVAFDASPIDKEQAIVYAALVLVGLYVLIIWEVVDRTFAAILASTLSIAILGAMHSRPSMETIIGWIDEETLLLLFGMMILVAMLAETGIFDYLAVYAYKITNGHVWPLITCLCLFTAVFSSFLDNVTMVLLMTPVTIRLCEVMALNAVPVLICIVIYSNIGGAMTPVGDPPNVIIASNDFVAADGVDFGVFVAHMGPAVLLVMLQTYVQIRLTLRYFVALELADPLELELRHNLQAWQRAAGVLTPFSKEEERIRNTMLAKADTMRRRLRRALAAAAKPAPNYQQTLEELQRKYPIRNKPLLAKCACAVTFVIALFFLHTLPAIKGVSLGWAALLGAMLLLILADMESMELVLGHVEWATLLFFAALFILMEALSHMGLIEWIGNVTVRIILSVEPDWRLPVSILIILWITAITSAFVDNIPVTTMMIKIVVALSQNDRLDLPLQPLVWALALGACLGGNGTLIGASANVVCAGVAEQHGYKFTFTQFFKIGFPIMLMHIVVSTVYLMVCHLVFSWH